MRSALVYGVIAILAAPRGPTRAEAQAPRFFLGAEAALVRLQSTAASAAPLEGLAVAGLGKISVWRFELKARYGEGKLEAASGPPSRRDLVEGEVMLGIRPVPWFSLNAGPHARGYVVGGVTERWLLWDARLRLDAFIAAPAVRGYLEVGGALSGNTRNASAPFGNSRGGEVGIVLRFPRVPIWLSLAYAVERTRLASNTGLDAMEHISAAVGLGADR